MIVPVVKQRNDREENALIRKGKIPGDWADKGLKSRIHRKGYRNRPLIGQERQGNRTRLKLRARRTCFRNADK